MGILDMFKRKEDDFDDLLKEPEGGNWNFDDKDPLGQQAPQDPLSSSSQGVPVEDQLGGGQDQPGDVMGLPPQSGNTGMDDLGMGSDVPSFGNDPNDSSNAFSQDTTSASALNLNTNYPSATQSFSAQNQSSGNDQRRAYDQDQNDSTNQYPSQGSPSSQKMGSSQEFDLILTKLDLIKSTLQNLDNRLYHIERKVLDEQSNRNRW